MQYKGKTLTPEQEIKLIKIIEGGDYVVQAPPGSGKTFLLLATARKMKGKGLNLTFNRSLAQQASSQFARHVTCKTGHALAFSKVGWKFKKRLQKITGSSLANTYNIGNTRLFRTPAHKGYLILGTIRKYCYSSDRDLHPHHVPHIPIGLNTNLDELRQELIKSTIPILNKMFCPNSDIPITHDIYLKKWALENPILPHSFILFDEYQDANPVISQIIRSQACQKIFVGDMFQQIYSWRGAINAISDTDLPILYLTKSFRFGQSIADLANQIIHSYYPINTPYQKFSGNNDVESSISHEPLDYVDCIICRTNNNVISETIKALKKGKKVYINGGVQQLLSLIQGIFDLKSTGRSHHPELFLFNSFNDLMDYANSPFGGDLKPTIKLLEKYSKARLQHFLTKTEDTAEKAEVTITTAHKAKGMEWPIVRLGQDFKKPEEGFLPSTEETNILYVAATRALNHLDISKCGAVQPAKLIEAEKINKEQQELAKV